VRCPGDDDPAEQPDRQREMVDEVVGRGVTLALPLVLFGVLVTLSNNAMSFLYHAYQSELYPTRIRAAAVGFVYSWSRLSTVFSAFVIAFFLERFGTGGVFALIAGSMLIAASAIALLGPPTTNRALEVISR